MSPFLYRDKFFYLFKQLSAYAVNTHQVFGCHKSAVSFAEFNDILRSFFSDTVKTRQLLLIGSVNVYKGTVALGCNKRGDGLYVGLVGNAFKRGKEHGKAEAHKANEDKCA